MINYIIVDDEKAAHEIIADYGGKIPYLRLKHHCYDALEAIDYLKGNQVDLIFLDINMPKLSGLDFLKSLSNPPKVILTTAYSEYALEGYELNVVDYLLKPFGFPRFVAAVNKVQPGRQANAPIANDNRQLGAEAIFVKDQHKYYQIKVGDILYLEAYGNYVKIHTKERTILSYQTLSSMEDELPQSTFLRIHKSYMVAKPHIQQVEGNRIMIAGHEIPIGKTYKQYINSLLER